MQGVSIRAQRRKEKRQESSWEKGRRRKEKEQEPVHTGPFPAISSEVGEPEGRWEEQIGEEGTCKKRGWPLREAAMF
jgi:hypothetical protein